MELAAGMDRKHELAQSEAGGMEGQERKVEQEDASSNARSKGCGNPLPGTPWYNKTVNRQQRRADEAVHRLGQLKKDATFFMIQGCQSHRLRARAGGDAKPLRFLLLYYKEWRHFCLECEKQERGWARRGYPRGYLPFGIRKFTVPRLKTWAASRWEFVLGIDALRTGPRGDPDWQPNTRPSTYPEGLPWPLDIRSMTRAQLLELCKWMEWVIHSAASPDADAADAANIDDNPASSSSSSPAVDDPASSSSSSHAVDDPASSSSSSHAVDDLHLIDPSAPGLGLDVEASGLVAGPSSSSSSSSLLEWPSSSCPSTSSSPTSLSSSSASSSLPATHALSADSIPSINDTAKELLSRLSSQLPNLDPRLLASVFLTELATRQCGASTFDQVCATMHAHASPGTRGACLDVFRLADALLESVPTLPRQLCAALIMHLGNKYEGEQIVIEGIKNARLQSLLRKAVTVGGLPLLSGTLMDADALLLYIDRESNKRLKTGRVTAEPIKLKLELDETLPLMLAMERRGRKRIAAADASLEHRLEAVLAADGPVDDIKTLSLWLRLPHDPDHWQCVRFEKSAGVRLDAQPVPYQAMISRTQNQAVAALYCRRTPSTGLPSRPAAAARSYTRKRGLRLLTPKDHSCGAWAVVLPYIRWLAAKGRRVEFNAVVRRHVPDAPLDEWWAIAQLLVESLPRTAAEIEALVAPMRPFIVALRKHLAQLEVEHALRRQAELERELDAGVLDEKMINDRLENIRKIYNQVRLIQQPWYWLSDADIEALAIDFDVGLVFSAPGQPDIAAGRPSSADRPVIHIVGVGSSSGSHRASSGYHPGVQHFIARIEG